MRKIIIITSIVILMGCERIPEGYTAERWAMVQESNPREARALSWIAADRERAKIRRIMFRTNPNAAWMVDPWIVLMAEHEMVSGESGSFKKEVRDSIQSRLEAYLRKAEDSETTELLRAGLKELDAL